MIAPMTVGELETLRAALRGLHTPLRTGPVQPNPYQAPTDVGGKLVCAGCGGVMWWPCPTRRLLDGEKVDVTLPELGAVGYGEVPEPRASDTVEV
jgi:hypothetical protein